MHPVADSIADCLLLETLYDNSKYLTYGGLHGLVPYAYDPAIDDKEPGKPSSVLPWMGFLVVLACLFIFYPVLTFTRNNARNLAIDGNIRINATGQAPVLKVFLCELLLLYFIRSADAFLQIPNT